MPFTYVTISGTFDVPDGSPAVGTVDLAPVETMHNGAQSVEAVPRRKSIGVDGLLTARVAATTDPGTYPPGVPYRITVRIVGERDRTYYTPIPHNLGDNLNLGTLLDWVVGGYGDIPDTVTVGGGSSSGGGSTGGGSSSGGGTTGGTSLPVLYSRGINMAGGEFAADAAHLPGTYGTDYSYDTAAAFTSIASRGHKIVPVPFRWERIQPTRNQPLNAAELARLQGVVSDIAGAGMKAVLDVHNFGRFIVSGGATLTLGTDLPTADLVDLWTRLSTAFKGNAGIYAYLLMKEPHDFAPVAGTFTGAVRYDWSSGVQGWTGDTATAANVSGQLRLSKAVSTGTVNVRKDDAATVSGGSTPTGNVLRAKMTLVSGSPSGTWTGHLEWQNNSFAWQTPTSTAYTRVDNGAVVAGLITGVPVYVTSTFSSIASPPKAFAVQVDGAGASAGTVTVDVDDFSQGSLSGAKTAAQVWEGIAQQLVDAIRANGDTTKIRVPLYDWSSAKNAATSHPAGPFVVNGGDLQYEADYYFDSDNSGVYSASYATENAAAVAAGYASLSARAVAELTHFTDWLTAGNAKGSIGEIGWPNSGDTVGWNLVGDACYTLLDSKQVDATYWAAGARWGTGYLLSAYTGAAQATVMPPATVIEAHPTKTQTTSNQSQIDSLTARVAALEGQGGPRSATPHRGPAYMVIGADTPAELAAARAAGATHGLVEVFWDRIQTTAGGAVDASEVNTLIGQVLAANLKVCLRVSLQYPPSFVQSGAPKFQKQDGGLWTGVQANGDNIRDWIWSRTGRNYVADLYGKLFPQLDWGKIERCQVGGGRAGELSLPVSDGTVWWFFGAAAQAGADLAPRMARCPVPSTTPSTGTTWTNNDRLLIGWLSQSMTNWMRWQIEQHRRWFSGPVYVMHPGFGLRTYMDPTGTGALAYREMHANGLDWAAQIGAYNDTNVHPYSTDIAAAHPGAQIYSDVNDGDAAAWLHLLKTARKLGRSGRIWGENTGTNSDTDLTAVFTTGAVAHGYEGTAWLGADSLSDGVTDTYANFTARIAAAS